MEYKNIGLDEAQIKFLPDNPKSFSGYASVFNGVDAGGDTILKGAYSEILKVNREVKMYYNHGWQRKELPIGKMYLSEDEYGLKVDGAEFTTGIELADNVMKAVQHKTVDGLSIGFRIASGGYSIKGNNRIISKIGELKEVSIVDFPMDSNARIDEIKSMIIEAKSLKEIENLLRDAGGFSRNDATALVSRIKSMYQSDSDAELKRLEEVKQIFDSFKIS